MRLASVSNTLMEAEEAEVFWHAFFAAQPFPQYHCALSASWGALKVPNYRPVACLVAAAHILTHSSFQFMPILCLQLLAF